ncbi:MAG TPA: ABC transporter ATP-binding protein [Mycobacteriales bacterium]|nr:ABC transporter ATP-binding protein [Mycobacteriales bacterium]
MQTAAFEVRDLRRCYRSGRRTTPVAANDGIDLDVPTGGVFGILGPNGAGKSTLIRQLVGLLRPDAGSVSLFGQPVRAGSRTTGGLVAYLAQDEPALDEMSVVAAITTTARLRGRSRSDAQRLAAELIDELGLTPLAARTLTSLSGGQRRLACVAVALVADRPVLVLDEPTTGLDPVARRSVWDALSRRRREDGTTVVLVTHNVLEAESVLDRVAILDRGRVIGCDSPGRLKASVSDEVRLDLVWRREPPADDPVVAMLAPRSFRDGSRWTARLGHAEARAALDHLIAGPALDYLDDFTLATPSLEDVYLALGGCDDDMERA